MPGQNHRDSAGGVVAGTRQTTAGDRLHELPARGHPHTTRPSPKPSTTPVRSAPARHGPAAASVRRPAGYEADCPAAQRRGGENSRRRPADKSAAGRPGRRIRVHPRGTRSNARDAWPRQRRRPPAATPRRRHGRGPETRGRTSPAGRPRWRPAKPAPAAASRTVGQHPEGQGREDDHQRQETPRRVWPQGWGRRPSLMPAIRATNVRGCQFRGSGRAVFLYRGVCFGRLRHACVTQPGAMTMSALSSRREFVSRATLAGAAAFCLPRLLFAAEASAPRPRMKLALTPRLDRRAGGPARGTGAGAAIRI